MCIAIYNSEKGGLIKKDILRNCWDRNAHGAGLMRPDGNGGLFIYKEMSSFNKFYETYKEERLKYPKMKFLLHFRIKTHGPINLDNCHPFLVNSKVGFIHNGILSGFSTAGAKSDTRQFNETVLRKLSPLFIERSDARRLIEKIIGGNNKMVFLTAKNERFILNKDKGIWFEHNWYSNSTFKSYNTPPAKYKPVSYTRQAKLYDKAIEEEGYGSSRYSASLEDTKVCTECTVNPITTDKEKIWDVCEKCLDFLGVTAY